MSRALLIMGSRAIREKAANWCMTAPAGTRVEFRERKRTTDQNSALWSLWTQIAKARPMHGGVKMTPDLYKAVFMQAFGVETVFLPTLDGDGVFPIGHRSSELSVGEASALIEFVLAWTAREGLTIEHFRVSEAA